MYRDAGDGRTLESLGNQKVTGKKRSVSTIKIWSAQYQWAERVAAFDAVLVGWVERSTERLANAIEFPRR